MRLEKVVLDLDDRFSGPATRAAASAALLHREVEGINDAGRDTDRSLAGASRSIDQTGASSRRAGQDLDRFSGRLRLIADAVAILGPGLVPIGAVGIPAIAGLANQMGAATVGAGTMILAFQGVGDALTKVNKAAIDPTDTNLKNARLAMEQLGEDAQELVRTLQGARPAFEALRDTAAAGLFPGVIDSVNTLVDDVFPKLEDILFNVGDAMGDFARDAAESLGSERWDDFLTFLATDTPATLEILGRSVGKMAHGFAELWMAFDPLNDSFSQWILNAAQDFDEWAQGLSETQGFQEFVDYIRENGPLVADALGSIANMVLQIVEAAAPLGGPVLQGLSAVADLLAGIANSNVGPTIMATVGALSLLGRGQRTFAAIAQSSWGQAMRGADGYAAKVSTMRSTALRGAGALGGLAVAASGAADGIGLTNTISGALMGSLGGPWGAAVGGAVGLMLDFAGSNEQSAAAVDEVTQTLDQQTGAITQNTREWAAKNLLDSGALGKAQRLGLDLDQVTEAALGNGDAVKYVNEETARLLQTAGPGGEGLALIGDVKDFRNTLNNTAGVVASSRADFGMMKDATDGVGHSFLEAASAAERFKRATDRALALLDKRAALRAARDAVRNFTKVLEEAPDKLRKNSAAYDQVQGALDEIARSALTAADHMKGMDRERYLRKARQDFIDAARKMGLTRDQAQDLARDLGLLRNLDPQIKITAQSNAADIAAQTRAILDDIDDEIVYIHTVRKGAGGQGAGYDGPAADGMTVPGRRWPYADSRLVLTAPGEEIISNRFGQADRHRELLKAINANRYADGGTVGGSWGGSTGSHTRVERIVETRTIVLDAGELGEMVFDTVDGRVGDFRQHDALNAGTKWAGVTSD